MKKILLLCPVCHYMKLVKRHDTDPKTAVYAKIQCEKCVSDFDETDFYDDNGLILELPNGNN